MTRSSTLLLGTLAILALAACEQSPTEPAVPPIVRPASQNETIPENLNVGDTGWEMSYKVFPSDSLSLYAAPYDVAKGDSVKVYIQAGFKSVKIRVYRIGYYNGAGARLRLTDSVSIASKQPPCTPAFPGPVTCPWQANYSFRVGQDWRSGLYLVKVTSANGAEAGYPLVVHSTGPTPDFTVVIPQFTWQAYNTFGGSGLYTVDPATGATVPVVAFSRPFNSSLQRFNLAGSDVRSTISWLERTGISVNYVSDRELADTTVTYSRPSRGYIFAGHDEYWTWGEFDRVQAARDAGFHLAFLAANSAFFNIRVGPDPTTGVADGLITCYKSRDRDIGALSAHDVTTQFRRDPLNRPENQLVGTMWYTTRPHPTPPPDYGVPPATERGEEGDRFLEYAGLRDGDSLHLSLAGEGDQVQLNGVSPPGLQVLLHANSNLADGSSAPNDATFYIASSGAGVFSSGNNGWPSYLDGRYANASAELVTGAVINWMLAH